MGKYYWLSSNVAEHVEKLDDLSSTAEEFIRQYFEKKMSMEEIGVVLLKATGGKRAFPFYFSRVNLKQRLVEQEKFVLLVRRHLDLGDLQGIFYVNEIVLSERVQQIDMPSGEEMVASGVPMEGIAVLVYDDAGNKGLKIWEMVRSEGKGFLHPFEGHGAGKIRFRLWVDKAFRDVPSN